jgi:uracil-DNA glycosylase
MKISNPSWQSALDTELQRPYFIDLMKVVDGLYLQNPDSVFPSHQNLFKAFEECSFDNVKVVILGQDPYHGTDSKGEPQATGLAFAVPCDQKLPPSLKNIFKEISSDLCIDTSDNTKNQTDGDLTRWAKQGVLLLNSTLTVEHAKPGSHYGYGWETFTDSVIKILSDQKENLVFMLWGNYAREKSQLIYKTKHLVLESSHPSPFSAHNKIDGFIGCKHFSNANDYLVQHGKRTIDWR